MWRAKRPVGRLPRPSALGTSLTSDEKQQHGRLWECPATPSLKESFLDVRGGDAAGQSGAPRCIAMPDPRAMLTARPRRASRRCHGGVSAKVCFRSVRLVVRSRQWCIGGTNLPAGDRLRSGGDQNRDRCAPAQSAYCTPRTVEPAVRPARSPVNSSTRTTKG